jgi:hypothetical protein
MTRNGSERHGHRWLPALRLTLAELGVVYMVAALLIASYRIAGEEANYPMLVRMGFIAGIPLLLLGAISGSAARRSAGRVWLVLALLGGVAPLVGLTLTKLAADGTGPLHGIGFFAILGGYALLLLSFVVTMLIAIVAVALDRPDSHGRSGPAKPTGAA